MSLGKLILSACSLVCLLAASALSATIEVNCHGNDQTWNDNGSSTWIGQPSGGVGYNSNQNESVHIMIFQLPDLGSETIISADLSMHCWDSPWGSGISADLYGLEARSAASSSFSDLYVGAYDTSGDNGTAIMQAFTVKAGGNPAPDNDRIVSTDDAASLALGTWLASLYAGGAQAGDFAILRVNPDTDYLTGSNSYINFDTGNTVNPNSGGYVLVPTLSIETTPEPATLVLLGLGSMVMIRRRK